MEIKGRIIETLRRTQRENIETVIAYMENHHFFDRGCHRHHKYDGGLADHAWQTYQLAKQLEEENKQLHPNVPLLDPNSLAICALLHDFCDCNGMHHIKHHGYRSAKMLKEYKKQGIPALKAAYAEEGIYVGADKLEELSSIKSKNEVIADIVALLQSPAKNVISALQSGGQTIHGVLKTLGERPE